MEMTNKKWYLYSLRAYKIQSIVILFFILVFYMYICIKEWNNPTLVEYGVISPVFICIGLFLYFEFIIIPVHTFFLEILKHIKCNRIKIRTKKSIAIYAVLSDLIWGIYAACLPYLPSFMNSIWMMLLVIFLYLCIGITIMNVIAIFFKCWKCHIR